MYIKDGGKVENRTCTCKEIGDSVKFSFVLACDSVKFSFALDCRVKFSFALACSVKFSFALACDT